MEDDPAIADLYAYRLRLDGYTVHLAEDVTTAEVIFERFQPDVVCVDTRLPGVSGLGVAEDFAHAGAGVILLTNDQTSYEAPPAGVAFALLKARTTPAQLAGAIGRLVASPKREPAA